MIYKIYVYGYRGYELLETVYDVEDVGIVLDNLNGELYYLYIVIEHNIKENSDTPIMTGYLDYNVDKRK